MNTMHSPAGDLIRKYNQPVPRYTSYPTVPYWQEQFDAAAWEQQVSNFESNDLTAEGISLYIHLPFCESLCTYCGCNKKISGNHDVEAPYLDALEKEWSLYKALLKAQPLIREIHLGGGTPTFFSAPSLERLMKILLKDAAIHPLHEFSIEGHPNNTTAAQLKVLYDFGFRRISYGVQDLNEKVQHAINRIQPFHQLCNATEIAVKAGFTSINFDLIYGLPFQTVQSISETFFQVLRLWPNRIAFYSYAHVPWKNRGQRLFDERDLPSAEEKLKLALTGRQLLLDAGYDDIGMDHFALPNDALFRAKATGTLHRNFMGYTNCNTKLLIGLGASSISDSGNVYVQNEKQLHDYYRRVDAGELPVTKGYLLNETDLHFKQYIQEIICKGSTNFRREDLYLLREYSFPRLVLLATDGLLTFNNQGLQVTEDGHYFLRNICQAFDMVALQQGMREKVFSKAV